MKRSRSASLFVADPGGGGGVPGVWTPSYLNMNIISV